jgi:hypothetical protein
MLYDNSVLSADNMKLTSSMLSADKMLSADNMTFSDDILSVDYMLSADNMTSIYLSKTYVVCSLIVLSHH